MKPTDAEKKYYFGTFLFFIATMILLYLMAIIIKFFRPVYAINEVVVIAAISMLFGAAYMEVARKSRRHFSGWRLRRTV